MRLNGARLPRPYVLNLRLTKSEDAHGRARAARSASTRGRTRQRRSSVKVARQVVETTSESGSSPTEGDEEEGTEADEKKEAGIHEAALVTAKTEEDIEREQEQRHGKDAPQTDTQQQEAVLASTSSKQSGTKAQPLSDEMRRELEERESAQVRATNAYPGAENSIGSVHQRKWFLSLDPPACGFVKRPPESRAAKARWVRESGSAGVGGRLDFPFYVRGPDFERSVVTSRLATDVLRDEGVSAFVRRKGWKPVLN